MMEPLKERLRELGVPSDDIWTPFRSEALMYFRDPSGNLFELYCHEGYKKANSVPVGASASLQAAQRVNGLRLD